MIFFRLTTLFLLSVAGLFLASLAHSGLLGGEQQEAESQRPGFLDTPYLPDGKWRVHDANRPWPPVVQPGTPSTQESPGQPPSDAVVLFDGRDLSNWRGSDQQTEPGWKLENGYLEVVPGSGSIFSRQEFGDCQIHVEWASPIPIEGQGQGRGNSGVIIMGHYEIQVLDSYQNPTYADGHAAAMYGQYPPLVNSSRKPGQWQTLDIVFEAPQFEDETLIRPAYATVLHNGVAVHHRQPFMGSVVWRQVASYQPHPPAGPLMLQNHGNPVRYRNVWVRPLGEYR